LNHGALARWDVGGLRSFPTRRSSDLRGAFGSPYCSDPACQAVGGEVVQDGRDQDAFVAEMRTVVVRAGHPAARVMQCDQIPVVVDRKSTRLNSSHVKVSYAAFCLKK